MPRISEDEHRRLLGLAYKRANLTLQEMWLHYFALGGTADIVELEAYLHGLLSLPPLQRDILAHALNERLDDLKVPYTYHVDDQAE